MIEVKPALHILLFSQILISFEYPRLPTLPGSIWQKKMSIVINQSLTVVLNWCIIWPTRQIHNLAGRNVNQRMKNLLLNLRATFTWLVHTPLFLKIMLWSIVNLKVKNHKSQSTIPKSRSPRLAISGHNNKRWGGSIYTNWAALLSLDPVRYIAYWQTPQYRLNRSRTPIQTEKDQLPGLSA